MTGGGYKIAPVYFDGGIRNEFHELLEHTPIFRLDRQLRQNYDLVCVMHDRVADAIEYLNDHVEAPRTVADYYTFMVYADNLYEGVRLVYERIVGVKEKTWDEICGGIRTKFFGRGVSKELLRLTKRKRIPDNTFFRYLRALSFAHPFETENFNFIHSNKWKKKNHSKGRQCGEVHYCPFVIAADRQDLMAPGWEHDAIAVRVYTNKRKDLGVTFYVSYTAMREFLVSRYEILRVVTEHVYGLIESMKQKWSRRRIGRLQPPIDTVKKIRTLMVSRGLRTDEIDDVIRFLVENVSSRYPKNKKSVAVFRAAIVDRIPYWCDLIDAQRHEELFRSIDEITDPEIPYSGGPNRSTKAKYRMVNSCLEKLVDCLCPQLYSPGLFRYSVRGFSASFARKWVSLKEEMPLSEIWLLVSAAYYRESEYCRSKGMLVRNHRPVRYVFNLVK